MQNFDNFFENEMDRFFIKANTAAMEPFLEEQSKAYEEHEQWQEREKQKAQSALDLFERGLTKTEIKAMAESAVESVLTQGNPLQVAEAISGMELFIKSVKEEKRFKDYVREEAVKYQKGGYVSKSGAKIEVCETGTAYDFSMCGDVELCLIEADLLKAENNLKERKEFLKKIPASGIDVIVPYSGEVIHIYPPSKSSNSSYKVSLAK